MKTMRDDGLVQREFGRAAVRVSDLRRFAESRKISIATTSPPIGDFEVVHLETFLAAIEGAVTSVGDHVALHLAKGIDASEAQAMIESRAHVIGLFPDEHHAELQKLVAADQAALARWLVPADVHAQWRELLRVAIASGELTAIDMFSGLPVAARPGAAGHAGPGAPAASPLPWWKTEHNIFELAQNIGATLSANGKTTSNSKISKEIAGRIGAIERQKGTDRRVPSPDTVRGTLTGWKFKPD